jgi:hypothetical protein
VWIGYGVKNDAKIVGAVVVVATDGGILFAKGYGYADPGDPPTRYRLRGAQSPVPGDARLAQARHRQRTRQRMANRVPAQRHDGGLFDGDADRACRGRPPWAGIELR